MTWYGTTGSGRSLKTVCVPTTEHGGMVRYIGRSNAGSLEQISDANLRSSKLSVDVTICQRPIKERTHVPPHVTARNTGQYRLPFSGIDVVPKSLDIVCPAVTSVAKNKLDLAESSFKPFPIDGIASVGHRTILPDI